MEDDVSAYLDKPPMNDGNVSLDILEPEEGWLFPADPDVKLAIQVTLAIAVILILKVVYDNWLFRRRQRQHLGDDEESERHRANTRRRIDEALQQPAHECPICLAEANFPVLTDCGHIFCCNCIIQYWQQSKAIVSPCDCAMCRCTFYMLLPVRWPTFGVSAEIDDQIHEGNMRIDDYNRRFSINRPPLDYLRDIPILIPYLARNFFNNDIFTVIYQIRIAFVTLCVVIYFLLPFDIVPESAYGIIGFLDDCIIGLLAAGALFRWFRAYMAERGRADRQ
ncbi:hypothetical protein GCK72_005237 [Caenorhabditis remanei]|uniref:E3 ubiquitin-protein ligase RNF170 n=1 Tax=Caenorhabditis remanei TaxID=31234 RepID=A0A6A5HD99_CAERE|nr:hypothetical protein GCK72_005237 [Caenorhabditis remanei]KAF1765285.1 hypothetical protein GCK72_005237 [Caenorhabditis remanei]